MLLGTKVFRCFWHFIYRQDSDVQAVTGLLEVVDKDWDRHLQPDPAMTICWERW